MFEYIYGRIDSISSKYIVIDNNDIGYIVRVPNPYHFDKYLKSGEKIRVYIYTYIREETYDLYGFSSLEERDLFSKLLCVKGIGPKGALTIIANGDINALEVAIHNSDSKYLQKFPGIGPKASGQIILDLRGKIVPNEGNENPKVKAVKEALKSLGYNNNELKKLDDFLMKNIDSSIEELIKLSLKKMI